MNAELVARLEHSIEREPELFGVGESPPPPYAADGVNIERLSECNSMVEALLERTGQTATAEQKARLAADAYSRINPDGTIDFKNFLDVVTNTTTTKIKRKRR